MADPLPCPFCGKPPGIAVAHPYTMVLCNNGKCPGGGWSAKTRAAAVRKWNRRAT